MAKAKNVCVTFDIGDLDDVKDVGKVRTALKGIIDDDGFEPWLQGVDVQAAYGSGAPAPKADGGFINCSIKNRKLHCTIDFSFDI
jgi:hypothetical protein